MALMEEGEQKNLTKDVGEGADFLGELEEDFGNVSGESDTNQTVSEELLDGRHGLTEDINQFEDNLDLREPLDIVKQAIGNYKPFAISSADFSSTAPSTISKFYQLRSTILKLISCEADAIDSEELLSSLNDLTPLIRNDIDTIHKCMVILYSHRFQELSSLVTSAVQYAKVVQVLERANLTGKFEEENYSHVSNKLEEDAQLTKEQTLVLMMSLRTSFKTEDTNLTEGKLELLFEMSNIIIELDSLATKVSRFVSSKVHLIAPNVCALLGTEITALLLSHTGGITALSCIPTCNLASIGKRRHLSHELHNSTSTGGSIIEQAGYIGRCELVQYQPVEYRKQMLRMLCAKVTLAARVDAGQHQLPQTGTTTSNDALLGKKWREEIETKITKLRAAPLLTTTKPLPVPEDKKRKRRAGRRYRKYKEQFQLSYLRQLQNRVEFGKPETTAMDSFGEEIGLGMADASLRRLTGGSSSRPVNNSAKMTKKMRRRLQEDERQGEQEFILSREDTKGGAIS